MRATAKLKLMIVDDDVRLQNILRRAAEQSDYEVQQVFEGSGVLEAARAERPDLILLDLTLPGIDGQDVLRALKLDPATLGIPVLLWSGRATHSDRRLGLELGAEDYVDKPLGLEQLMHKISSLIEKSSPPGI